MPSAELLAKELLKILRPARKKVFHRSTKEGAELARRYRELGPDTLYRYEGPTAKLRAVGELPSVEQGTFMKATEPRGLYFGNKVADLPDLINPHTFGEGASTRTAIDQLTFPIEPEQIKKSLGSEFIRARLLPEARVLDKSSPDKWDSFIKEYAAELPLDQRAAFLNQSGGGVNNVWRSKLADKFTKWLQADYDAIKFPDVVENQPHLSQTVLLNKGKAIGRQGEYYRLLSAGGAFGASMALSSADEAEASPIGDLLKGSAKEVKKVMKAGIPSRTAKHLKGTQFRGKTITDVLKVDDDWRHIHLDDGTVYPVTRDVASNLVRKVGTVQKMEELATKDSESQLTQALKSLVYHESRSKATSREEVRKVFADYLKGLEDAGVVQEAVPYALVRRGEREFTMPREYATILAREGHVIVIEGKEALSRPTKSGRKLQLFPWGRKVK